MKDEMNGNIITKFDGSKHMIWRLKKVIMKEKIQSLKKQKVLGSHTYCH